MNVTSKAKAGAVAAITGALFAVITTGLYLVLVFTEALEPFEWQTFGLHLATALLGGLANLIALVLGRKLSLLPLVVCAYFILIQLGGLESGSKNVAGGWRFGEDEDDTPSHATRVDVHEPSTPR